MGGSILTVAHPLQEVLEGFRQLARLEEQQQQRFQSHSLSRLNYKLVIYISPACLCDQQGSYLSQLRKSTRVCHLPRRRETHE